MYNITVQTYTGYKKEYKIIEEEYACFYFNQLIQAIDVESVIMIDGLTGEVLMEYDHGKIEILF